MITCGCCGRSRASGVTLNHRPDVTICDECAGYLRTKRDRARAEHAGVTAVMSVDPIFSVSDVAAAVDHYRRLGFDIEFHDESYAFAVRDDVTIHLTRADDADVRGAVYLHVDDADRLAEEWRHAGIETGSLTDTDYGKREGAHTDPDGNRIRFGSPQRAD